MQSTINQLVAKRGKK